MVGGVVTMRVQEVLLDEDKKRYILIDGDGMPVIEAIRYLKYLDSVGRSIYTQKTYCYALKHYFSFLRESSLSLHDISINLLGEFITWLKNPYHSIKVTPIEKHSNKTEKTINLTLTVITNFYDYLYRTEQLHSNVIEQIKRESFSFGHSKYKDFLYHVNKGKSIKKNILKLKIPKQKLKVLTKEEVDQIYKATTNIRDKLLIKLLFETGFRIGEALSLYLEDFKFHHKNGHRICLKDRGELINGAKLKSGERSVHVSQELMDLYDDYLYDIVDDLKIKSNFVFVKISGERIGQALTYQDVNSLFRRLKKKTGIDVHPHLLRHTHATLFYQQTKDIKQVQERLGHSQIQTTIDLYLHPSDEHIRAEWEKAQPAFQIGNSKQEES